MKQVYTTPELAVELFDTVVMALVEGEFDGSPVNDPWNPNLEQPTSPAFENGL